MTFVQRLGQQDWAERFAQEMQQLRAPMKGEKLIQIGMSLWHTLGQARPEDIALFEVRAVRRDEC